MLTATDIEVRYATSVGPGDSATGVAAGSLGGYMSQTRIVGSVMHNLFDVVTGAENEAMDVEYRCLFFANTSSDDSLSSTRLWIESQVGGGASCAIGLDPGGVVAMDSATAQAVTAANESTAPAGVTFSSPTTEAASLEVGTFGPGECFAVWVRRTAANTPAVANDGVTLRISGGTI